MLEDEGHASSRASCPLRPRARRAPSPPRASPGSQATRGRSASASARSSLPDAVVGNPATGMEASREPAARERAPAEHAEPVRGETGNTSASAFRTSSEYGGCSAENLSEVALVGDPLGRDDLVRGRRRGAEVADLAGANKIGEGVDRVLDVGVEVPAVQLIEVDPVGREAPQALVDRLHDPAARAAAAVRVGAHRHRELRGQHHLVATAGEGSAEDLLRFAGGVGIRRLDEVDPASSAVWTIRVQSA